MLLFSILISSFCLINFTFATKSAFFAVLVQNPTVVQQVVQIQQNLTKVDPQFVKFLHNVSYLHVRLNSFEVENETSFQQILTDLPKVLCNVSTSIPVMFAGTEIRQNRTLFGKMNAMSSSVITTVHKTILTYLNSSNITSLDSHEIFHSKMDIVELDEHRHDDLLEIMQKQTFRLSTGDFIKEIVLFNVEPKGYFHEEIGRFQLSACKNYWKFMQLLTNRIFD
ncbi:unnamed protein product [Caenorhabditis angaria]|uniref:DUF38 domain-containing protein n=1 Tax=Caenorhabditis angaria TaxID=860376 RepID=A0A9P1IVL0_9PELO|nr:unnamed protein product [Caenorhabditis angaria]